jgi:hypothetical protein
MIVFVTIWQHIESIELKIFKIEDFTTSNVFQRTKLSLK